jgi:hypothetical protein
MRACVPVDAVSCNTAACMKLHLRHVHYSACQSQRSSCAELRCCAVCMHQSCSGKCSTRCSAAALTKQDEALLCPLLDAVTADDRANQIAKAQHSKELPKSGVGSVAAVCKSWHARACVELSSACVVNMAMSAAEQVALHGLCISQRCLGDARRDQSRCKQS